MGIERLGFSGSEGREVRDKTGQVQREKPYDGLPRPSGEQSFLFWSGLKAQPTGHHLQNIAINL